MTLSCREPASPPSFPLTPFVSAFTQGAFMPSAIPTSVRGTSFEPSGAKPFLAESGELGPDGSCRLGPCGFVVVPVSL